MDIKDQLRAEALRLGFSFLGFARPEQPLHFDVYEQWIEAGYHGSMEYLATERARQHRHDPKQILAECRTILVAAIPYWNPAQAFDSQSGEPTGRVAAYAWGEDYHEVVIPRLEALVRYLEQISGSSVRARWYTDTGPILERDLAQRAGFGWIGKNTCLISTTHGSFFLLSEILIDLELEPDEPFTADRCGECSRCIQVCPTGCIRPDRTIDATRCISYLTIENKGPIPLELRPLIGDWVFGCDLCQIVCPWNKRFAPHQGDPSFAPRPGVPRPLLRSDLHLTPQEFNRKFKNSPIRRTKRRGYLRNITVALGNLKDEAAIPDLIQVLQAEPEPLVRAHAAWALGQMPNGETKSALEAALTLETNGDVLKEIRLALENYGSQAG